MNIVVVSGTSMRPYLQTDDVLYLEKITGTIPFGGLVMLTARSGEKKVHRYLGKNKIKGDRAKYWDEVKSIDYLVSKRIFGKREQNLTAFLDRWILGLLSGLNLKSLFLIHHLAAGLLAIIGKGLRNE